MPKETPKEMLQAQMLLPLSSGLLGSHGLIFCSTIITVTLTPNIINPRLMVNRHLVGNNSIDTLGGANVIVKLK